MANVFSQWIGECKYTIQVHQYELTFNSCKSNAHGSVKGSRSVPVSEWNANELVQSVMRRESGYVFVRFLDFWMPFSTISHAVS